MKLSEKEKSISVQNHELIVFKADQQVQLKKEFEKINGGYSLKGYVESIRLDRNGIWYEVIYRSERDGLMKSTSLLAGFLEAI
ncbi:hypothetical protein [Bacillus badius]|uniref:Uncharacterized protein n=1 Tax=Bacillus badius TaxID=1455 RepID=A0ABR5AP06_BACBA|nr:hypothetical protein [Bacillus badius]KIL73711.1 hypothetical protein SD77_2988 [Bacillus badius]MED4715272.1 hypothetical protein [Bacillus badius]